MFIEIDESRTCAPIFLPLRYSRMAPKDEDEEKRIDFLLFKTYYCLREKLQTYIGPSHCVKLCRNCLCTYLTHNEQKNQKLFRFRTIKHEFSRINLFQLQ